MAILMSDRSFAQQLAGLLIAAILALLVSTSHLTLSALSAPENLSGAEMSLVQGRGLLGNVLIGVGIAVAVISVGAIMCAGVVIVAAAAAGTTTGVAAAASVIGTAGFTASGGAGVAAVGGLINWLED